MTIAQRSPFLPGGRALRVATWLPPVLLAGYAIFLGYIVYKYIVVAHWPADDAFFFVRYANNFLDSGKFSWNAGEAPVYGNTSQIYQFAVTALYWLTGRNAVQTVIALGVAGLWAAAATTLWAFLRVNFAMDRRRWTVVVVGAVLAVLLTFDRPGLIHALIAMETTWAAAFVALAVVAVQALAVAPDSWLRRGMAGAMIVLLFAIRPDATLIGVALLGGAIVWGSREVRQGAVIALLGGFAALAIYCAGAWLYYGSLLPLAANMKIYGVTEIPASPVPLYVENINLLGNILLNNQMLTIVAIVCMIDWRSLSPVLRGATVGLVLFFAYHLVLTVHITGLYGRYYFPGVPLLFILGGSFCVKILNSLAAIQSETVRVSWLRIAGVSAAAVLAMQIVVFCVRVEPLARDLWLAQPSSTDKVQAVRRNGDSYDFYAGKMTAIVDALDPGCVIAGTEDGVLSVLDTGPIIDISGLHNSQMAHHGFSAQNLFDQKPDILIMPHPALFKWAEAIRSNPAFLRDYEVERPKSAPRFFVEIGYRKDSACAQKVRQAL